MRLVNTDRSIAGGTGNFTVNAFYLAGYHYGISCSQVTASSIIMVTPNGVVSSGFSGDYSSAGKMMVFCNSPMEFQFVIYNL